MPTGIGVVDTMIGLPTTERREGHPASYLFGETPSMEREPDSIERFLREMDRFGIERGLVPVTLTDELHLRALAEHPDRLFGSLKIDPNLGATALRELEAAVDADLVVAAQFFPAGKRPPVPINDPRAYAVYAKCVELDIPVFVQGGVPGPRVPAASQHPGLVDDVCFDFPDLGFVFRHGSEPVGRPDREAPPQVAESLLLDDGVRPEALPASDHRVRQHPGADKIMFGSYYPWGFELARIFDELDAVLVGKEELAVDAHGVERGDTIACVVPRPAPSRHVVATTTTSSTGLRTCARRRSRPCRLPDQHERPHLGARRGSNARLHRSLSVTLACRTRS